MQFLFRRCQFFSFVVCYCGLFPLSASAGDDLIAPGAEVKLLSKEFKFTEGPVADPKGNVYFTDQPNDRILKWNTNGELSTWMQPCGRSNGLDFDAEGNLWACADEQNQLWKISPEKDVTIVVKEWDGKLLNGPNDLWIHPQGGIYFTDPYYKRGYWKREQEKLDVQGVYYLPPGRQELNRVADDLVQPNGIIGTPDGKQLYVADIRAGKTWRYDISENGSLTRKTLFCELGSDGMTIDERGNVYLTGKGVTVFNPEGQQIAHFAVDAPWTANVCFGGKDHKTLLITASQGLYSLQMNVSGAKYR